MTDEEILKLASEVLAGKARSYVGASRIFAEYIRRTHADVRWSVEKDIRGNRKVSIVVNGETVHTCEHGPIEIPNPDAPDESEPMYEDDAGPFPCLDTPEVDGWAVNVIRHPSGLFRTVFSVGVQHFTIAESFHADEAELHCEGMKRMFLGAIAKLVKIEGAKADAALAKINVIRNSIIAMQGFNFSEHAYPLVAALNEAGLVGEPYPVARENLGTLIERATKAEAEVDRLRQEREETSRAVKTAMGAFYDELGKVEAERAKTWHFMPSPGIAACGADYPNMSKTANRENVTCITCTAFAEISADFRAGWDAVFACMNGNGPGHIEAAWWKRVANIVRSEKDPNASKV